MHKDVEFHIDPSPVNVNARVEIYKDFGEASSRAVLLCLTGTTKIYLDVVVYSEEGAKAWGGDDAVTEYVNNPEASVFARIEIKVNWLGMVP